MSNSTSAEEDTSPHFHKFPEFPDELQLRIWELAVLAIAKPRSVCFSLKEQSVSSERMFGGSFTTEFSMGINPTVPANHRVLLDVGAACIDSRNTMKSIIPQCYILKYGHSRYSPAMPIAFNPSQNAIYLPSFLDLIHFQKNSSLHVRTNPPRTERLSCIKTLVISGILETAAVEQFLLPNGMLSTPQAGSRGEFQFTDAGGNMVAIESFNTFDCFHTFRGLEKLILVSPVKPELADAFPEPARSSYRHEVLVDDDIEGSHRRLNLFFKLIIEEWKAIPGTSAYAMRLVTWKVRWQFRSRILHGGIRRSLS
ncbi:hypothetical protein DL98DRAFT_649006 [Cadophora sp. DSE1049]|nr:hypothetical protein DL98DRAFT_649006 [Cadophora sp. DSE1049]